MKAFLKNYRQSPRKVRLVANLVKGKKVALAMSELDFLSKRAGEPIKKVIKSAINNAKHNFNVEEGDLYVKNVTVNKGNVMKRFQPMSRGRAFQIKKKMSHIQVELAVKGDKTKDVVLEKPAKKKLIKKEVTKVEKKVEKKKVVRTKKPAKS